MRNITDILPVKEWVEFEVEINREFGLNAAVFDEKGIRLTNFVKWANQLCPIIKGSKQGQTFICAAAQENMAARAQKLNETIVDECDAELLKIISPLSLNGEFFGVVSGCGLLSAGQEVESFLISKITGINEEEISRLSNTIAIMKEDQLKNIVHYIEFHLCQIINCSQQNIRKYCS